MKPSPGNTGTAITTTIQSNQPSKSGGAEGEEMYNTNARRGETLPTTNLYEAAHGDHPRRSSGGGKGNSGGRAGGALRHRRRNGRKVNLWREKVVGDKRVG